MATGHASEVVVDGPAMKDGPSRCNEYTMSSMPANGAHSRKRASGGGAVNSTVSSGVHSRKVAATARNDTSVNRKREKGPR